MTHISNRFLLLLLAGLALLAPPRAAAQRAEVGARALSESVRVSLITVRPGDAVYSMYGHSALRVYDPATGLDVSFNYGTFDFDAAFLPRFLYGELDYFLSAYAFPRAVDVYRAEGRPVIEQRLALGPAQTRALFDFLQTNLRPENRYYRYHFLFDNCSTRIRDALAATLGDDLRFAAEPDPGLSFRRLLDPYQASRPFLDAGIDVLLGLPVDQVAEPRQTMFLPDYLAAAFDAASVEVDGAWRPLVAETDTIVSIDGYDALEAGLPWASAAGWALLAAGLFVTLRERRGAGPAERLRAGRWLDGLLFAFAGFAGLFIAFLWFVSLHDVTEANWNLLWAWPTHLAAAAVLARGRAPGGFARAYLAASAAAALVVLAGWPLWPQDLPAPVVPLLLLLALRAAWITQTSRQRRVEVADRELRIAD